MYRFMRKFLVAILLLIVGGILVSPVSAATTEVHIVRYANDGTTVLAETTVNYSWMEANLPVLGDGVTHYYHQGPVFIDDDNETLEQELRWNPEEDTNVLDKDMGAVKGTNLKDLCDLVGGMSSGEEVKILSSDGFTKWFAYENVYGYSSREGPIGLTWYMNGNYPDTGYTDGMRLVWFADTSVNPYGYHAFGNFDWHEAAAPMYWYYYQSGGENYPTTTGLSAMYVNSVCIYSSETPPVTPVADFNATPLFGDAPLTLNFIDESTGYPTSWAWDFNNDGTVDSTEQNPSHIYDIAGTYTVNLTVTNAAGSDDEVKTDYISVQNSGGGSITVIFPDDADNCLLENNPDATGDISESFYAYSKSGGKNRRGLIHFNVSSLPPGATIHSANLYLYMHSLKGEYQLHDMHRMNAPWTEATVTWANLPAFESIPSASASTGTVAKTWIRWDVSADVQAFISGTPNYGWLCKHRVESLNPSQFAKYWTKEYPTTSLRPYLEVTYTLGGPEAPVAAFTADPTTGTAPLTVQFTDQSTNTPTSWAWDVDHDGTIDYATQNATHTYTAAGNYTVNLTVANEAGSDDEIKTEYITVTAPAPALLWGPYLTGTTTTGTVINAKSGLPTTMAVDYATDAYYTANSGYDQVATDGVTVDLHHVALAGLIPDTLYHYRVLFDGQATGDLHFRTFPESGPVKFIMYSDTQDQLPTFSQLERHKLVADRIAEEEDVAFVLNSGDLVNNPANLSDWYRYFTAGSRMMANTTVYPALGNHDANNTNYYQSYGLPQYYSFDCGAVHVAVLDSNSWAWDDFPVQSAWLEDDLQTGKPFKFVSFHHPPYTSEQNHFGGYENIRLEWEDEFIRNDVIAVFNGHVHAYERLFANDITYFVSGTGGGPSYILASPRTHTSQNSLEYALAYIRVTVDPSTGTATAEVIRVADVSSDLKNITTLYPPGTVFETVAMNLADEPIAAFTSDVQNGTAPLTVQFTDQSTNTPTSWAWDVDNDGTVDYAAQNATHTFATAGNYTVNLTVTNAAGSDSVVKADYITVTPQSQGDREVYLSPSSSPVANGNTTDYEIRVSSLPEGLAGYDLIVTVDTPIIAEITEVQYPGWAVLSNTTPSAPADSLRLSGVDIGQSIEAGAGDTLLATITVRADSTGTSAITLSSVNMDADGGALITPSAVTLGEIVVYIPMVAEFEANVTSGKASAARPLFVAFTDLSAGVPPGSSWSWDFDNNGVADSILQNPVRSYTTPGNYTVSLTVQNAYSSDTETKSEYIQVTSYVKPFPEMTDEPTDPDGDSLYEDINGNGRLDYDDIVMYYENMQWIRDQVDVDIGAFDYNQNGRIDYDDIVVLYQELLAGH